MKKIFVLVIGLMIFSATNFANAAHYWAASYEFEGVTETFYVDSDKLEVIYFNNGQLYSSKDKNIVNSTGVLFKVGYVRVAKNHQGKEYSYTYDVHFYRKIENNLFSVFNDLEVSSIINRIKLKREVDEISEENIEKNGLRWLNFGGEHYYDASIESADAEMACLGSIYKKARELFRVQNNYGQITNNYLESRENIDYLLENFHKVENFNLGTYHGIFDGKKVIVGNKVDLNKFFSNPVDLYGYNDIYDYKLKKFFEGKRNVILTCYLMTESIRGNKNNFRCVLISEVDEGPESFLFGEKYNFVNRNGEIFYSTSNNANLEKITNSDFASYLYQVSVIKL